MPKHKGMNARYPAGGESDLRVLVVEDDPSLGRLVQLVLSRFAGSVQVERTGGAAIEAARHNLFHAVACDISLPDMSGLDVIAALRQAVPTIGVVAITGFVDVDVAVRSMKAGADDFLGKPFDAEVLWHLLNKAILTRRQRIAAEQAEVYRQLAYTDALTGCPNRRFVDEFIDDAVETARRENNAMAVAYFDIDNFKLLNDFVGHDQGDAVLRGVSNALAEHVTEPNVYGRFGGDEFVAVFPKSSAIEARRIVERIREAVQRIEVMNGSQIVLPTRVSVGISTFKGMETPRDLIAAAEDQMYVDKSVTPALIGSAMEHATPDAMKISNLKALRNLVKAIDRRDSYTRFHSDHATHLAATLGRLLMLPPEQMTAISIGGPIHDLGKIVVPDDVLRKPGPLTLEERKTMEEHPVMGAAIAAAVTDLDTVVNLVRHHHERFDGEGYPGGLAREEITYPTRIFTLADAYSAMTTDRPYRKGLSLEQAVDQIMRGRGTQFDPDLAIEFVKMVEREYGALREDAA
ncbi:MAG: diguanylate cyclase [Dehalococcoidia bacterium]